LCIKTLSEIPNTVGVAIILAVIALTTLEHAWADTESCEYSINNLTDPSSGKTLLLTKSHFLQTPVDINSSHAVLSAARLQLKDPSTERRYLRVRFVLVEFVETEDEAKSRSNLTKIPKRMPLVIGLADGSTMILTSWSNDTPPKNSDIRGPSELGNSSTFFRVSHSVGGSYWLDDDQVAVLLGQPATMLQVTTTQGDFSLTIHPSRTDRIQHVLGCL
jgi:hypothetical protein